MNRAFKIFVCAIFFIQSLGWSVPSCAQSIAAPAVSQRAPLTPVMLRGVEVNAKDPFRFDFIIDKGDSFVIPVSSTVIPAKAGIQNQEQLKQKATQLIKYFLTALAIPDDDLWVTL